MAENQNIPLSGMTDAYPLNVKANQYPFMLNGNIMTDISTGVTLTNEHSNYLCNELPEGFKVIGTMFVHEDNIVYLWLVNPASGASQIGYLSEYKLVDVNDQYVPNNCDECAKEKQEASPLETRSQPALCSYTPVVTDGECCSLGFNIDYPIRKGVFKKDNCGDSIYFTDFLNPPRVLRLQPGSHLPDDTQRCIISYTSPPCVEPNYAMDPTHVDCVQLQIFPTVSHIHTTAEVVGEGGTLKAGVYQLAACYADHNGQRATRTFSASNAASIFDINQTVTDQVNYVTDKAIRFNLSGLNNVEYSFIDIFVISTINGVTTVRQFDTVDITSLINDTLTYVLSDFEKGLPAVIDDVFQVFPVYELAQEITTANNALLLANLVGPRDLNLQQAVIQLSPFVQWKTYESLEDLYADGAAAANDRSFLRDEVYPLGIIFERNNTLDTCVYPFVGRAINTVIDSTGIAAGYQYFGYWVPNGPTVGVYPDKAVVTYGSYQENCPGPNCITYSQSYVNTSGGPVGPTDVPGVSGAWLAITEGNAPTYHIVPEGVLLNSMSNADVIIFPSCGTPVTELPTWQVYNTAYNRGLTCGSTPVSTKCVQRIDDIICNSESFTLPTLIITITSGTFLPTNTVTGVSSGATGTIYSITTLGTAVPQQYIVVLTNASGTPFSFGETITSSSGGSGTEISYSKGTVNDLPNDCYTDLANTSATCADNYTIPYTDASVEPGSGSSCAVNNPPVNNGCNTGFVRTSASAISLGVPLCIDDTLASYTANYAPLYASGLNLNLPYAVRKSAIPVQLFAGGTNLYNLYDICGIANSIPVMADPTPTLNSVGTPPLSCLNGSVSIVDPETGQPTQAWLWNGLSSFFSNPSTNYLGENSIGFQPNPDGGCTTYQSPQIAPLMYFLGDCLPAPANHDSCNGVDFMGSNACVPASSGSYDYWGTGGYASDAIQGNLTKYQSYWYNFTATAAATTLVIKVKLFYKDMIGGYTNEFQPGDLRIDVYANSPTGSPVWSTGNTNATYYYDNSGTAHCTLAGGGSVTDVDTGVLVIGDVANSTGDTTAGARGLIPDQPPLTAGTAYYVHIYLLTPGRNKLNVTPLPNPNATQNPPTCPCYLPEYAWASICINNPATAQQVSKTLPAEYELQCTYDVYYRVTEVPGLSCNLAPYEFGDFAYWESATKTYPNNTYLDTNGNRQQLWGQLCGQPIRHFKFPDCLVAPLQDQDPTISVLDTLSPLTPSNIGNYTYNPGRTSNIYPVGLKLNTEDVKNWLAWAVTEGLISDTERRSITGYKIVRGNRATNKSIGAKGLLLDMWKYNEYDWVSNQTSHIPSYFSNYPFNDLGDSDPYLNRSNIPYTAPNGGTANDRFAFHSPETCFNSPTLGDELKLEASMFGSALGNFYQVLDHPKYILLSEAGIVLASVLAGIQLSADLLVLIGELLGNYNVGFVQTIPVGSIIGILGASLGEVPKFFIYAQQWETIITNFGVPQNFAYYYAAVGNYHSSGTLGAIPNTGDKRRLILNNTYLLSGNLSINELGNLSKINNYMREDSVYMHTQGALYCGAVLDPTLANIAPSTLLGALRDTSKFVMSGSPQYQVAGGNAIKDLNTCGLVERKSQVASNYASMKYYLPDQYGSLQDIEWLYTGVFSKIDWNNTQDTSCDIMLGGDEFIVRFTKYIKIPFFLDNPVGTLSPVDFQYHWISNITNSTYYFNSVGESSSNSSSIQFKPVEYNLDCNTTGAGMYIKGNMYLFSYGIISFICESDYNLNYRRCTDITKTRGFYPYQSDVQNVTQEYKVPIEVPNNYLYNRDYSKQNKENVVCSQPAIYNNQPCVTTYRNRVINSIPDTDNDFYRDNWKIFLGGDFFDFPLTHGYLNGLDGIERDKVMVRFADTTLIFNAFYTLDVNAGSAQLGTASLFANKPEEEVRASVGYAGTESHAFISTPMGHFWVDTERHKVFILPPAPQNAPNSPQPISDAYDTFFINNLPFYILLDFPGYNVDNPYKDVGMSMDWDYRFNRLFLTKLDYQLLPKWSALVQSLSSLTPVNPVIVFLSNYVSNGTTYDGIYYVTQTSGPSGKENTYTKIDLTDQEYFCDKSWTISYSPVTKAWISFYSFLPNYYIGHAKYLQTGVNYIRPGANNLGVWNHFISNKSYQVFYGTLYPFITDVIVQDELYNKQLHSIEYQADFLRFQNDYDYYYNPDHTFNKAVIWTENQNSGNLVLVPQKKNDLSQAIRYPMYGPNSTTVMVTRRTHNWRINQFFDLVANKHNNVPPMILNCSPYYKDVNQFAINYNKPTFQRQLMTSDYFTLRLINDTYSNYKIISKWFLSSTIKSYS